MYEVKQIVICDSRLQEWVDKNKDSNKTISETFSNKEVVKRVDRSQSFSSNKL